MQIFLWRLIDFKIMLTVSAASEYGACIRNTCRRVRVRVKAVVVSVKYTMWYV